MRPPSTDLRLLPAAVACWGTCLLAVRMPPGAAAVGAACLVMAAVALATGAAGHARLGRAVGARGHARRTGARAAEADGGPVVDPGRGDVRPRSGRPGSGRPGSGRPGATGSGDPAAAVTRRARWLRVRGHGVLVLVVCAAGLGSAASQRTVRDGGLLATLTAEGSVVRVVGTVRSEAVRLRSTTSWDGDGDRYRVDLGVEQVSGGGRTGPAAAPVLVLAGSAWRDVRYGARVETLGVLEPTAAGDDAVALLVVRGPPRTVTAPGPLDRGVALVRQALLRVSDGLPPDQRGLVPGAAIGDTSRVPDDLDAAMRVAGLTHVTAVSGAHFAIVGATVLALTGLAGLPRTSRAGVVALAMVGFVLLVHPAPSVLRAAVMGGVGVSALVLGRPSRAVPALATCVLVLLVADPWLGASIGFALSVVVTAGIVLGSGPLARGMTPLLSERAARLVAVPLAAQCACGPVVVLLASGLPTYAVPANLAAAPALAPATVLGVLAALLAPWWPDGGVVCARAAGWAVQWVATVARVAAGLPAAHLPWPGPPLGPVLLAVATAGIVVAVVRPRRGRSAASG